MKKPWWWRKRRHVHTVDMVLFRWEDYDTTTLVFKCLTCGMISPDGHTWART